MLTFTDFAFYRNVYKGALCEADYNGAVFEAHAEIVFQTSGRAIPESMQDAVEVCECSLVDVIAGHKKSSAMIPDGITSVSNDGLKVTKSDANLTKVRSEERRDICVRFLQTPVNLMYRGI